MSEAVLRPTLRLKLTLVYGALFLLTGAILLALNYGLVSRNLPEPFGFVTRRLEPPPESIPGQIELAPPDLAEPVGPDGRALSAVLREASDDYRQQALNQLLAQSGIALLIMAFVSGGLGWLVAGRVLRPLQDITSTAKRLSEQTLHERINLEGPQDELKELADTFDEMLGRLDRAFDAQRRFVANASHELRTPLSIIRTELDVTLDDPDASSEDFRSMGETVRSATERTERLIDSLLVLAKSEREVTKSEPVDLAHAAAEALRRVQPEAEQLRLTIERNLEPVIVWGDTPLLDRMAGNLIENAVRHNRPEGWVRVSTAASQGKARLEVSNSGPVIPEREIPSLFEPFRRFGADRTGSEKSTGLGLSIVRSVIQAHGGKVTAEPIPEGGLALSVSLPTNVGSRVAI